MKEQQRMKREIEEIMLQNDDKILFTEFVDENKILYSYADILEMAEKIETMLGQYGFPRGSRIALLADASPVFYAGMIACVFAGYTMVIIDASLPKSEILWMAEETDTRIFLTGEDGIKACNEEVWIFNIFTMTCLQKGKKIVVDNSFDEEAMAILFSSGTTSQAKGVVIGYAQQRKAIAYQKWVCWKKEQDFLTLFPIYHISGFSTFWGCMFGGGRIALLKRIDAKSIAAGFAEFHPTVFGMVPKAYEQYKDRIETAIAQEKRAGFYALLSFCGWCRKRFHLNLGNVFFSDLKNKVFGGKLQFLGVGGGILEQDVYEFFYKLGYCWLNVYASTEMNIPTCVSMEENANYPYASIGRIQSLKDIEIRVVNADENGIGELYVKTPARFLRYYNDEEMTKKAFEGEWFKSGDLGYIDKSGYIFVTGRNKESIHLSNGEKVSPDTVEKQYAPLLRGYDFACCGMKRDGKPFDDIHLYIAGCRSKVAQEELCRLINESRGNYPVFRAHFVDRIPRTSIGKVKRYLLKEDKKETDTDVNRSEKESIIVRYAEEIFGRTLYEREMAVPLKTLGMDSLDMMELWTKISEGYSIEAAGIDFERVSIKQLEKLVESVPTENAVSVVKERMEFYRFLRIVMKPVIKRRFRPIYLQEENIVHGKKIIFAPNHRQTWDAFIMMCGLEVPVHWAALKRFFDGEDSIFNNSKNKGLRFLTKHSFQKLQMVPIDREGDNTVSLNLMYGYLKNGGAVGIYPEGTTNKHPEEKELNELKMGAFKLAMTAGADIQPISIVWDMKKKHKVAVCFGKVVLISEASSPEEIREQWKLRVLTGIDECKKALQDENRN